ncbi:hypothetical protein [Bifidobacterium eulemuris]|uniref:Phage portal protein gp6 n=1 Tax=Bifidobacterium eulemuris TaxID=1765219 RepID=A0A261GA23_9BIFI|nr:hypothetical protein [Bifidobacterium eulemuris]OZG68269.1 Phage portal protein gp6 [Bifidobacterium eulemuris]QOL31675.1 hypothetical protein BE0216_03765 [Bifidobacterium eulemuris]
MDASNLVVQEESEDAFVLTNLARQLGRNIPRFAELKAFKDGREMVDESSVPQGVDPDAAPVYQKIRHFGSLNLARRISEAVTDHQQPNGFRRIGDEDSESEAVDGMYRRCRMATMLRRDTFPDAGDYGCAYGYVGRGMGGRYIRSVSPWECVMSDDGDSAVMYTFDAMNQRECMDLFRLSRDDSGYPVKVYSRTAVREAESRSLLAESDDEGIDKILDDNKEWDPGNDWEWEGDENNDFDYALRCGSLPIVQYSTPDGKGLFEPHLPTLKRIDRQLFDRLCITMMQAFRQRALKGELPQAYAEDDPLVLSGQVNAGDPIDYSNAFRMAPAAMWNLPEGVDVWESQVTETTSLQANIVGDIKQLAATSGIPLDVLSPDVQGSAAGADLKREGLKFKVENLNMLAADAITLMLRMAMVLDGDASAADADFEMMWKPVDTTSQLELAQAAQLEYSTGLKSRKTILTHSYGFTAQDIAEDDMNRLSDQFNLQPVTTGAQPATSAAATPATGWDVGTLGTDDMQAVDDGLPEAF